MEKSTLTKFHDAIEELNSILEPTPSNLELLDTLQQCMRDRVDYWIVQTNKLVMEKVNLQDKLDDASTMINSVHEELHNTLNENAKLQSDIDAILGDAYRYRALVDHFLHKENNNYNPLDSNTVCAVFNKEV